MLPAVLLHLPSPQDLPFIPRPPESHHAFGAGFLFIGAMITAESLAGKVWHANMLRRLAFPAMLVFLGWGMIAVAFLEPNARLVHLTMGLPLVAGGWAEGRYRLGELDRRYADVFIVPALVLAAIDTAFFHLNNPPGSAIYITHSLLALLALTIAALRLYQSQQLDSVWRSLFIAMAIVAVGLDLWIDAFFQ